MNLQLFLLLIVVVTALAFDFTNGFHDTGNAMATSIASGALAPRVAVALSAVLNLIGAFLSTAVAATIAKGLIDANLVTLELVFAGLVGGIVWNLLTWLLGIPSSSSHALIGGIVGATIAAVGLRGVIWSGVVSKVIVPAVVAALLATLVGAVGTWLVYRTTRGVAEKRTERGFRRGQIGSASLVSLAHGTNDAQKTMGVIFLALMSYGAVSTTASVPPLWVIVSCAVAMAAGTYLGGWRIIRTLGKGLVEIKPPQGMAAESSSAAVILLSAHFGYALSTTQVATGSVLGSGVGRTETALLERYQVSRAVLREAVRLLEYHAIAHMRRGPGGGLVVTTPQPQASIDTIALYLQYRKPSREDLRCVRDAIEIDNVAKVVKRRSEPEVASFLDTLGRPRLDNPTDDVRAAAVEEFRFHVGLARAAGNTMLDLFLLILVELFRRHLSSTEQALPTWSDVVAVGHAHVRILEAIGSGDDSLARCRTRRHLDAAASWWL